MSKVRMYCTRFCPYCIMANRLLNKKDQQIDKFYVDDDPSLREKMLEESSGRTSVPQIFIDDRHIGGYTDMVQLDHEGKLDILLGLNQQ